MCAYVCVHVLWLMNILGQFFRSLNFRKQFSVFFFCLLTFILSKPTSKFHVVSFSGLLGPTALLMSDSVVVQVIDKVYRLEEGGVLSRLTLLIVSRNPMSILESTQRAGLNFCQFHTNPQYSLGIVIIY